MNPEQNINHSSSHSSSKILQFELTKAAQSLKKNPSYQKYIRKAKFELYLKKYYPVIETCSKAIEGWPDKQEAYNIMGKANSILGNYQQAEKYLEKSIGINQNFSQAFYEYGFTLYRQGKYLDGLKMFEKGIARQPKNNSVAYIGRAQGFFGIDKFTQAHKNMIYAKKALQQINEITYLTNPERQIVRAGMKRYHQVLQQLQKVSITQNLPINYKTDREKEIINKISLAIHINNMSIIEKGYYTVITNVKEKQKENENENEKQKQKQKQKEKQKQNYSGGILTNSISFEKQQKRSSVCNCKACQIF